MAENLIKKAGIDLTDFPEEMISGGKNIDGQIIRVKNENRNFALLLLDLDSIKETEENLSKTGKSYTFGFYKDLTLDDRKIGITLNAYIVKEKEENEE
jgi:hypothetical protein